jgi:hypothetical protein
MKLRELQQKGYEPDTVCYMSTETGYVSKTLAALAETYQENDVFLSEMEALKFTRAKLKRIIHELNARSLEISAAADGIKGE